MLCEHTCEHASAEQTFAALLPTYHFQHIEARKCMDNPNATFADLPVSEKKFPWGCLFGGCATVLLLVVLGTAATIYGAFRLVKSQVEAYTSATPSDIPVVNYTPEEIAAARKRLDDFKVALEKGEEQPPLVLTADDINAIISSEKEFAGKLFVKIEDGEITGEASFPADAIPLVGKGRYFNGSVSLKASLEKGNLVVTLDEATVNGKPVPAEVMEGMRNQNLAKDAFKDPKAAEFLSKFESLTIDDNCIILIPAKPKTKPDPKADAEQPSSESAGDSTTEPSANSPSTSSSSVEAEVSESTNFEPASKN